MVDIFWQISIDCAVSVYAACIDSAWTLCLVNTYISNLRTLTFNAKSNDLHVHICNYQFMFLLIDTEL